MSQDIPAPSRLLSFVERSPAIVAANDRAAWLALFTERAVVADPVGTRPHVGIEQIGRFYDTFIAPNRIEFEIAHDVVCGSTVVRDATLHIRMWGGAALHVPAFLRYELVDDPDGPRIDELYAYWELPALLAQLRSAGPRGAMAAARLAPTLLGRHGVGGAVGFARGLDRVDDRAKAEAAGFADALRRADPHAVAARLAADAELELGGAATRVGELGVALPGVRWSKMIVAGRTIALTVRTAHERGVLLLEFAARHTGIHRVRLYR